MTGQWKFWRYLLYAYIASIDNKIRVWEIPEGGIEEDLAEPKFVFGGKIERQSIVLQITYCLYKS